MKKQTREKRYQGINKEHIHFMLDIGKTVDEIIEQYLDVINGILELREIEGDY